MIFAHSIVEDEEFLHQLQVEEEGLADISSGILGIYGTPLADGEFAATIDGGRKPGVDDFTVNLFTKPVHIKYEQLRALMEDAEGEKVKLNS